jgi:acetolactate synthase-1/2/3 large subunit
MPENLCAVIANLMPENAILMDESLTSGTPFFAMSQYAKRFTHLMLTGGAIGMGPGGATGAAVACPDRKVINFQADGSGAYNVQALWTQARENLDVVTVVASNRRYAILDAELARAGITYPGVTARSMGSLSDPDINWVSIAEGFGVEGNAVTKAEELMDAMEEALSRPGPKLIEAVMG